MLKTKEFKNQKPKANVQKVNDQNAVDSSATDNSAVDKEQLRRDVETFVKNFSAIVTGYKLRLEKDLADVSALETNKELVASLLLSTMLVKQFCELYYDYRKETKASDDELNAIVQIWDAIKALYESFREGNKDKVNIAVIDAQKVEYLRVYDFIRSYLVEVE